MIRTFNKLRLRFGTWPLERKIALWGSILIVPFVLVAVYLLYTLNVFFASYDRIADNVAGANTYNIAFKDEMDDVMYQMVARALRQDDVEAVPGMTAPGNMIAEARETFRSLQEKTVSPEGRDCAARLLNILDTLEEYVAEIDSTVTDKGAYDENMAFLDNDVYIMTDLIQARISEYIYYETNSMSQIRRDLKDRMRTIVVVIAMTLVLFSGLAVMLSVLIVREQNRTRDLELKLLQEQINPHFLYNTLDNIIWMSEDDRSGDVADIVMYLSEFFRRTLSGGRTVVRLREEFAHVEAYLKIQSYRYGDLLQFEMRLPEELENAAIVKMTLQPVVENALYHGIKNKRGGGTIRLCAEEVPEGILLTVSDDGVGMSEEKLRALSRAVEGYTSLKKESAGFGLANVSERLRMRYGDRYGLQVESTDGEGTVVSIRIPKEEPEETALLT